MSRLRRRNCLHCKELFHPHPAVGTRQKYCSSRSCQQARKAKNNHAFLRRNPDYHRGPIAVSRTQSWRSKNPGYWRRPKKSRGSTELSSDALQAELNSEPSDNQLVTLQDRVVTLQAELVAQQSVFQGFAAQLTGCALQAELSSMLGQWHDKGVAMGAAQRRIYGPQSPPNKGDYQNDEQEPYPLCRTNSKGAETI